MRVVVPCKDMAAPPGDPKARLVQAIRGYIHMDNLVENLNTQATNARELRSKHETEAIGLIKQLGLSASTIQVSGAQLQVSTKKEPAGLTWTYLEREVPAWGGRNGVSAAQISSLMAWLKDHRDHKECEHLKKLKSGGLKPQ
jgi:hypothetical protein